MAELLAMTGVRPDMAAGHSYGELAALCTAGVYGAATLLELSGIRAGAILAAAGDDPGAMASVRGDAPRVAALLAGTPVVIANHNAPDQVVISGPTAALEAAAEALTAAGLPARRISVACAFHSPLVAPAAAAMAEALARKAIASPRFPVFANSTAEPYPDAPDQVRRLLADQVAEPVRFAEQVEAMYAAGARTFVEVGPGRTLTGLVQKILGDRPYTALACDVPGENGLRRFLAALAELVNAGVPVDPWPLFGGRAAPVKGTPSRPNWTVDGQLVRTADGEPLAGGLQPATTAPRLVLGGTAAAGAAPAADAGAAERDAVVTEFLRGTRELIAVQREVVLGYLGTAPLPAAPPAAVPLQLRVDPERTGLPPVQQSPAPPALATAPAAESAAAPAAESAAVPATAPAAESAAVPAARPSRTEIAAAVVAVISARTGYPPEMLGTDLDLEADLSVDSIKRTEIIAALAERLGLALIGAGADDRVLDELSQIKTINGITDWLDRHLSAASGDVPEARSPEARIPQQRGDAPEAALAVPSFTRAGGSASGADVFRTTAASAGSGADLFPPAGASAGSGAGLFTPAGSAPELSPRVRPADGLAGLDGLDGDGDGGLPSREALPRRTAGENLATYDTTAHADSGAGDGAAPALARRYLTEPVGGQPGGQRTGQHDDPYGGQGDGQYGGQGGGPGGGRRDVVDTAPPLGAARLRRLLVEPAELAPAAGAPAAARQGRFLIVEDGRGVALELADLLEQRGAEASVAETPSSADLLGASALVHLGALRPGGRPVLPGAFGLIRDALAVGVRGVVVATVGGGTFGQPEDNGAAGGTASRGGRDLDEEPADLGLRGLMRTVATEYPHVLARAVDIDPKDSPRDIATLLLAELCDPRGPAVVGYRAGRRTGLRVVEAAPPVAALTGAGITGAGLTGAGGLGLSADSVVLLTGGARGITASVALALARSTGCHIELLGRTPPPGPADPQLDTADPVVLRQRLIARGGAPSLSSPRQIEAETQRMLRERQVRVTMDGLRASAASVRYHAVDVRDASAVSSVFADVYGRYGRLDGVVHGAGVVEDRLITDKTPESFARVYGTKVDGVRGLVAGLRRIDALRPAAGPSPGEDGARFLVLFGSVSGVFGNRGQADYSAANDALDTLAQHWSGGPTGRVLAVDWGPWAGGGMITPELEREYARRGVALIDPADGVAALLAELADPSGPAQVVYLCGEIPAAPRNGTTGE
ncbi:MAG TPA: SDR family NAD(P)-dependent oxidoreductase [Trebonia sp.]